MSTTDSSMESEATLLGDDLCLSDIKLLSETTMNSSQIYDASIVLTSTPAIVVNDDQTTKFHSTDTLTKCLQRNATTETYTKKGRRRLKSVDLHIGEKTIISSSIRHLSVSRPRQKATLPLYLFLEG